jgi:hypothetical protein
VLGPGGTASSIALLIHTRLLLWHKMPGLRISTKLNIPSQRTEQATATSYVPTKRAALLQSASEELDNLILSERIRYRDQLLEGDEMLSSEDSLERIRVIIHNYPVIGQEDLRGSRTSVASCCKLGTILGGC